MGKQGMHAHLAATYKLLQGGSRENGAHSSSS